MKYSVYQHWDPLKVCMVGRSYGPEIYSFIKNSRVRNVMERIAYETEEDYQKLIQLLKSFGVEVLRPPVIDMPDISKISPDRLFPPPMTPRDYSISLGNDFYFCTKNILDIRQSWDKIKGSDWPADPPASIEEFNNLPKWIVDELMQPSIEHSKHWQSALDHISQHANVHTGINTQVPDEFNSAMTTRIGKDIYIGTHYYQEDVAKRLGNLKDLYPDYRFHVVNTNGHSDGTFCPVVPGLIVSLNDIPTYQDTFPGWEVIYLPNQSWNKLQPFFKLKQKNHGKWWVPGEELNDDFTDFVEQWLGHWVGYVEETVFDVNMLVIDEKNVICNNYNEAVFKAFERYGVTPHVINFRHRYFWDGGLHCITSDVHREGNMKDYFPERG